MLTFLTLAAIVVGLELLLHNAPATGGLIASQRKLIAALKDCVAAKDRLIEAQRARIAAQEIQIDVLERHVALLKEVHDGVPTEPR